mmetsp:Transcript_37237/g.61686  ORF Transcript_37237/g.61686 Transcript_37237/m.61686 type:complete len:222 (-) Transcript_37237:307-972(-)
MTHQTPRASSRPSTRQSHLQTTSLGGRAVLRPHRPRPQSIRRPRRRLQLTLRHQPTPQPQLPTPQRQLRLRVAASPIRWPRCRARISTGKTKAPCRTPRRRSLTLRSTIRTPCSSLPVPSTASISPSLASPSSPRAIWPSSNMRRCTGHSQRMCALTTSSRVWCPWHLSPAATSPLSKAARSPTAACTARTSWTTLSVPPLRRLPGPATRATSRPATASST